jgi:hypothetical protein
LSSSPVRLATQQETGFPPLCRWDTSCRISITTEWSDACPWRLCMAGMLTDLKTKDDLVPPRFFVTRLLGMLRRNRCKF